MRRGWRVLALGVLVLAIVAVPGFGVGNAPEAKAAPASTEQGAGLVAAAPDVRLLVVTDDDLNHRFRRGILRGHVHILSGNKVEIESYWLPSTYIVDVGVEGGRGYIAPVIESTADILWWISWCSTEYSSIDKKVYLAKLPRYINARSMFGRDVNRLPTILDITTFDGLAIATYSWP